MPVTKTAKRALRSSKRKQAINKIIISQLASAIRIAKKTKKEAKIKQAISLADKARKKSVIHKNKASRIKSTLAKLLPKKRRTAKKK
ncbi:MAG: 30S ribosomal protein S20 [Patescibacteria group bacterium]